MKANYKRLWHILLDRDMKKKELAQIAGVSTYTINKLNKNDNVTVEVLGKICKALDCTLDDIMEFEEDVEQVIYVEKNNNKINITSGCLEFEDDNINMLELIAENMDGGKDSIEKRLKVYGSKKY